MDAAVFFAAVRVKPFGGPLSQSSVDGLIAIQAAWEIYGDGDANKLGYIDATAFHEADRFRTMEEYASGSAYEGRSDLGNTQKGDGVRFKGRGFVQLTGRRNYADWSERLGVDLLANPGLVTDRAIAARILVQGSLLGTFTGKKLGDYIAGSRFDFLNARRVINGVDKNVMIKGYAESFAAAVRAATVATAPPPQPEPSGEPESVIASLMAKVDAMEQRLRSLEAAAGAA